MQRYINYIFFNLGQKSLAQAFSLRSKNDTKRERIWRMEAIRWFEKAFSISPRFRDINENESHLALLHAFLFLPSSTIRESAASLLGRLNSGVEDFSRVEEYIDDLLFRVERKYKREIQTLHSAIARIFDFLLERKYFCPPFLCPYTDILEVLTTFGKVSAFEMGFFLNLYPFPLPERVKDWIFSTWQLLAKRFSSEAADFFLPLSFYYRTFLSEHHLGPSSLPKGIYLGKEDLILFDLSYFLPKELGKRLIIETFGKPTFEEYRAFYEKQKQRKLTPSLGFDRREIYLVALSLKEKEYTIFARKKPLE